MCTKVAIVTGSNKGLGFEVVKGLCQKFNGVVYLTSRNDARGLEACKQLQSIGLTPNYYQLDVTNEKSIKMFFNFIKDKHGQVDLIINNAGVLFLKDCPEPYLYQVEQTMATNFYGLVNFTETMFPILKNGGNILNISSSSGHLSRIPSEALRKKLLSLDSLEDLKNNMNSYVEAVRNSVDITETWGNSPYVVSKVGVNAYTFILHRKLREKNIKVNCVHPGYVRSDMTRGVGSLSPAQAAQLVLSLALDYQPSGGFVWHNHTVVPWDGPDPRVFIDGNAS